MRIFVIGSSITSSYWNGAATYYRGIYRNLAALGHSITFAEPDAYGRQQHRDEGDFDYVESLVYSSPGELPRVIAQAMDADLVIKHSGVGVDDAWLEAEVASLTSDRLRTIFWDVDAPATLARVEADPADPFRGLIPQFDHILTYGGGAPVVQHYQRLGARHCIPIYNALEPETHFPAAPLNDFACDLAFMGNRLPDRERRVEEMFLAAAEAAPEMSFLLGGEGWGSKKLPGNVRWIGHVATHLHNAVNSSARMVLNINRDSMASVGFSPPTRVFEAAGSAACLICDEWPGVGEFFSIGEEILIARDAEDVVRHLRQTPAEQARSIGLRMRERALRDHTYAQRAQEVDAILKKMCTLSSVA